MRRRDLLGIVALICVTAVSAAETRAADADLARKLVEAAPAIGERSLGRADAPVTIVEYASATCPHCAAFHNLVWSQLRTAYIDTGKIRWIFREFPLDDLAMAAFMLARCSSEDRYFDVIATLFGEQKIWAGGEGDARAELTRIMAGFGMDKGSFDACVQRLDLVEAIYGIVKTANQDFGVKSTPTFFIEGELVSGAQEYSVFSAKIDAALAGKGR
jgi:protein-disulfide isomerase